MLRWQGRNVIVQCFLLALIVGVLIGEIVNPNENVGGLFTIFVIWVVLLFAVVGAGKTMGRRADQRLRAYVSANSPAIGQDPDAPLAPAQVVRRRPATADQSFVAGYAPAAPPAFAVLLRVVAAEGPRLALALMPSNIAGHRRSYVGVRLDPGTPDVAVVDVGAAPEAMGEQYAAGLAASGGRGPSVVWGSTALWAAGWYAAGLVVGLVIGLLL